MSARRSLWAWAKFRANTATMVLGTVLNPYRRHRDVRGCDPRGVHVVDHPRLTITDPQTGKFVHVGDYFATLESGHLTIFVLAIPLAVLSAGLVRITLLHRRWRVSEGAWKRSASRTRGALW